MIGFEYKVEPQNPSIILRSSTTSTFTPAVSSAWSYRRPWMTMGSHSASTVAVLGRVLKSVLSAATPRHALAWVGQVAVLAPLHLVPVQHEPLESRVESDAWLPGRDRVLHSGEGGWDLLPGYSSEGASTEESHLICSAVW